LYDKLINEVIRREAYPTSGGLAARDIAAMSLGLADAINEDFLRAHITSVRYLAEVLMKNDIPIIEPVGGHAVVVMPRKDHQYFAFALAAQVFLQSGVRGGVFDECFRVAIPRRVYTKDQLRYAGESIASLYGRKMPGLRLVNRPHEFFNFLARFTRS
jgi:tyrosine phenol-lyase